MGYPTHAGSTRIARWKDALGRLGLVLAGLVFFTLSLQLMREGIAPLGVWFHTVLAFNSPAKALGFGWLFASIALSGSPVAATAISFFDAGILTQAQTFAMIAGSRLGASFIVLVVGFAHRLRGHQRALSYSAGLLSLLVTQSTYIIALPLGLALLRLDWLAAGGLNVTDYGSSPSFFPHGRCSRSDSSSCLGASVYSIEPCRTFTLKRAAPQASTVFCTVRSSVSFWAGS